jgi:[methyl-Co(III) methanol-specific corrinoid protein]:coenzyme M methyltransferase
MNADKAAALAAYPHEHLGFDSVMPYFSIVLEAATLGGDIDWGNDFDMPVLKRPLYKEPGDFKMTEDFLGREPVATLLSTIRMLKKRFGRTVLILGKALGPWTLGLHMYGMENFLVDTLLEPQKIHDFIKEFCKITICLAEAQLEAGADMITIADHITADIASPKTYREFLMPVHKRILAYFPRNTFILHCCGKTTDRISLFAEAGFPVFHFDSKNNISDAMHEAGQMILTGCVNNLATLLFGSTKEVENQTRKIMAEGIRLISPECAIPLQVKNENLRAISLAVRQQAINSRYMISM